MKLPNLLESHQPGHAQTAFITWKDMASAMELDQVWGFVDPEGPLPQDVLDAAFREADSYIKYYGKVSDEDRIGIETSIAKDIALHWSAANILPQKIKVKNLVDSINTWSQQEPENKNIFGKPPFPDIGLEYLENEAGVSFTIYPAFEIPYVETYYALYDLLPELNLDDITGWEVAETLLCVQECLGGEISIDLNTWENNRLKDY